MRWHSHMSSKDENDQTTKCMHYDVAGVKRTGGETITWKKVSNQDE